ncbi:unnamed protein product [Cochlearia groenlandica]
MPYAYTVYVGYCDGTRRNGLYHQASTPLLDDKYGGKGSRSLDTQASTFDVTYNTNKNGLYQIFISSGNIVLNGGQPFITKVFAGEVNVPEFNVNQLLAKVPKEIKNEIHVIHYDDLYNSVPSQRHRLKWEITPDNTSSFTTWDFVDNKDGTYTVDI